MSSPSSQLPIAYRGRRTAAAAVVETQAPGGTWYALDLRLDLRDHSPTGLEWGYGGSGLSQLSGLSRKRVCSRRLRTLMHGLSGARR